MAKSRSRKQKRESSGNGGVDRLSELPDAVLLEIMCHLPLEEAIDTRFLSKKWRCMWKSLPVLEFVEMKRTKRKNHDLHHRIGFVNFVDRVVYSRDHLRTFSYTRCHSPMDLTRLGTWLMYLAKIKVGEVNLEIHFPHLDELPPVVFNNTAELKAFVLKRTCIGRSTPPSIILPRPAFSASHLTTLTLRTVQLPEVTDGELVINCPRLENLAMIDCVGAHLSSLLISCPRLTSFLLDNGPLCICCSCGFNLDAPNLQTLNLSGSLYMNYRFITLSSLTTFTLLGASYGRGRYLIPAACLFQFLQLLCNVTNLSIPTSCTQIHVPLIDKHAIGWCHPVEIQSGGRRSCLHTKLGLPQLSAGSSLLKSQVLNPSMKLKCLKLTGLQNGSCSEFVAKILKDALSIETLLFEFEEPGEAEERDWATDLADLSYDHLKYVKIVNFGRTEAETALVAFVLKNAPALKKMIISYTHCFTPGGMIEGHEAELEELMEKIRLYPRASLDVDIVKSRHVVRW